jgi:cation diffusion facilitator family transporter
MNNDELLNRLKHLVDVAFYSLIPLALLSVLIAVLSNSLTVLSIAIDYGISFVVQLFAFQSIRAIIKSNVIKFPYGTGKLENFSGFLYGALAIPTSFYILYVTAERFFSPSQSISLSIAQLALIPSLARTLYLFLHARRLNRQTNSPMVESYYINFKVTIFFDVGILLALAAAMILTYTGHASIAGYIDPAVSLFLSLYMLYNGVILTASNFKILMDLPLPEDEQLKIMNVLTREFENYENIGTIYTRRSGRQRFIDIELYLNGNATIADTARLQSRMQSHLEEYFDDISFTLIPLPHPCG